MRMPEPWEFELLRLIAEQGAIPFDQLARFLDCEQEQAARVAKHLTKVGYADYGRFLVDEPHWAWLTWRGARLSGTAFRLCSPKVGAMARMRAVNEVRLHIAARASRGALDLRAQRRARTGLGVTGPTPWSRSAPSATRSSSSTWCSRSWTSNATILETHMARYDAVIEFANPRPRALLERLKSEHHWPKLVIRPIPRAELAAAPFQSQKTGAVQCPYLAAWFGPRARDRGDFVPPPATFWPGTPRSAAERRRFRLPPATWS